MHESELQSWMGRTVTISDDIATTPVRALSATLDRDDAQPERGTPLPPLWHWLHFLPAHRAVEREGPVAHRGARHRLSPRDAFVRRFEFRAIRPTFDGRPMRVNGRPTGAHVDLWAEDHEGWLTMKATAELDA